MLRNSNNKGFTIIEVVITIAIGAAVMALVLNAVAGARRSQRNNARASDVNQIAAAVNQYIAARNALPAKWGDISGSIDKFGHYVNGTASINPAKSLDNTDPAMAGDFPKGANIPADNAKCVDTSSNDCYQPAGANSIGAISSAPDMVVVVQQAQCIGTNGIKAGGIREMAILYRLEGQADEICLEV